MGYMSNCIGHTQIPVGYILMLGGILEKKIQRQET